VSIKHELDAFMDHDWDGFYETKKRLPRFPATLLAEYTYNISYASDPQPSDQNFTLRTAKFQETGVKIRL